MAWKSSSSVKPGEIIERDRDGGRVFEIELQDELAVAGGVLVIGVGESAQFREVIGDRLQLLLCDGVPRFEAGGRGEDGLVVVRAVKVNLADDGGWRLRRGVPRQRREQEQKATQTDGYDTFIRRFYARWLGKRGEALD